MEFSWAAAHGSPTKGPPETTTIRLNWYPNICLAPKDIAEDLLHAEGFTDVRYVPNLSIDAVARGEIDFDFDTAAWVVSHLDAGEPILALSGVHSGCYELFAHEPIRAISDLKGKKLGVYEPNKSGHLLLSVIAAQVGVDPHREIEGVTSPTAMELFAEGKVDALLGHPPEPQELRARKIGRVIFNLTLNHPWSQYLCCIAYGNRNFVRAN